MTFATTKNTQGNNLGSDILLQIIHCNYADGCNTPVVVRNIDVRPRRVTSGSYGPRSNFSAIIIIEADPSKVNAGVEIFYIKGISIYTSIIYN